MQKGDRVCHIDDPTTVWVVVREEKDSAGNPLVWVNHRGINKRFFSSNVVPVDSLMVREAQAAAYKRGHWPGYQVPSGDPEDWEPLGIGAPKGDS